MDIIYNFHPFHNTIKYFLYRIMRIQLGVTDSYLL